MRQTYRFIAEALNDKRGALNDKGNTLNGKGGALNDRECTE